MNIKYRRRDDPRPEGEEKEEKYCRSVGVGQTLAGADVRGSIEHDPRRAATSSETRLKAPYTLLVESKLRLRS